MVQVINKPTKPTRVTKNTATAIDHIITNSLLHWKINTEIIKLDVLDYFPIFLMTETEKRITPERKVQITKRLINNKTKKKFKNALQKMTWDDVIVPNKLTLLTKPSSINSLFFMIKFLKNMWLQ